MKQTNCALLSSVKSIPSIKAEPCFLFPVPGNSGQSKPANLPSPPLALHAGKCVSAQRSLQRSGIGQKSNF